MMIWRTIACCAAAFAATTASARPAIDCPLRDVLFSAALPLIDIIGSPAAQAATNRVAPEFLKNIPAFFRSTKAPTFSAIITLDYAAQMAKVSAEDRAKVNAALASVPVTQAERDARCARYDNDPLVASVPKGKPAILLFEKMTGFRDGPSVDAAHAAFLELARDNGWSIVATDRGGAITPSTLAKFDAVIWNNVSGDVLTLTQRKALRRYVEGGGGFVAVHGSAGDPAYFWDWYRDTLVGAQFIGHPIAKQFQSARVVLDDASHHLASGLPAEWTMSDEWYSFASSPRLTGAHVLARLDEASYSPVGFNGQDLRMGDHPIAWTRCVKKGRSFYSAIGHVPEAYGNSNYRRMLVNAIAWAAAGRRAGKCLSPS